MDSMGRKHTFRFQFLMFMFRNEMLPHGISAGGSRQHPPVSLVLLAMVSASIRQSDAIHGWPDRML